MKGWVYIITDQSRPNLIKIGFSINDPQNRANTFGTGSPYSYQVVYKIWIKRYKQVEKSAHDALSLVREGKEWFRCDIACGIAAIKTACSKNTIDFENALSERNDFSLEANKASDIFSAYPLITEIPQHEVKPTESQQLKRNTLADIEFLQTSKKINLIERRKIKNSIYDRLALLEKYKNDS